jgi:hypothetical protein
MERVDGHRMHEKPKPYAMTTINSEKILGAAVNQNAYYHFNLLLLLCLPFVHELQYDLFLSASNFHTHIFVI